MQAELSDRPKETFVQLPPIHVKPPYSDETRQNCIWLYEQGHCLRKIQELTGIRNRKILRAWLVEAGLMISSIPVHEPQKERCLSLYQQGLKPSEVEDITHVPADITAYWAAQADVLHANPVFTASQKEECLQLYRSGCSAKTVEQRTGVPDFYVKQWIKESGSKRERIYGTGRPSSYTEQDKPPEADSEFVAQMEEVLDVYARPYDANCPVICMDEQPIQLHKEMIQPIEATAKHPRRVDYEYERAGTASIFMFTEPLSGWRQATARTRRTKVDWAVEVAALLEGRYAQCEQVFMVCDNLNTHTKGAFYQAFQPERARQLVRRRNCSTRLTEARF